MSCFHELSMFLFFLFLNAFSPSCINCFEVIIFAVNPAFLSSRIFLAASPKAKYMILIAFCSVVSEADTSHQLLSSGVSCVSSHVSSSTELENFLMIATSNSWTHLSQSNFFVSPVSCQNVDNPELDCSFGACSAMLTTQVDKTFCKVNV